VSTASENWIWIWPVNTGQIQYSLSVDTGQMLPSVLDFGHQVGGLEVHAFDAVHVRVAEQRRLPTRGKVVTSRWPDPSHGGVNLGFPVNS
jgi:hypothetical protein